MTTHPLPVAVGRVPTDGFDGHESVGLILRITDRHPNNYQPKSQRRNHPFKARDSGYQATPEARNPFSVPVLQEL